MTRERAIVITIDAARKATGADQRNDSQTQPVTFARALVMLALYDEFGFRQAEAAAVFGMKQPQFIYSRRRLLHRCSDSRRCVEMEREFQRLIAERIG